MTNLLHKHKDPIWLAAMGRWVSGELARLGRTVTGPAVEVRVLPWSAVFRCPTDGGDVYFKACAPSQGFEPALALFLADRRPDDVLPVLAADLRRAWLLLPDGGGVLRDALANDPADVAGHWAAILPQLAALQVALAGDAGRLLALGLPDRRPAALPGLYAGLLDDSDHWPLDHPDGLTAADLPPLRALTPRLSSLCEELEALGPPATLVHDDLHDGHVFVAPSPAGPRFRFFDYGDACLGHPFFQMIAPQRFYARRYDDLELDDATVDALYDVYLAGWGAVTAGRRRALRLALAVGPVLRALTWHTALGPHYPDLPAPLLAYYARGVGYWLTEFARRSEEAGRE